MKIHMFLDKKINKDELMALIDQYKFGRYCEDVDLPVEASRQYVADQIQKFLAGRDSECVQALSSSSELQGLLAFKLSRWDTDHFGYNVALIDTVAVKESDYFRQREIADALLKEFIKWCQIHTIRFISVKVPALNLPVVHSFENHGFHFYEAWIFNKFDHKKLDIEKGSPYSLRFAQEEDFKLMLNFSKGAFSSHRFFADPHIPYHKADSLYTKWIRSSIEDSNQKILTLDFDNKPVAFMTFYENDLSQYFDLKFAMWKMAVLDPTCRGKGFGTDFFISLMFHHRQNGLDITDSGISMRNVSSLNLHTKLNFKFISTLVTFHKWLD
jgi:RimJ/RimL family protein N-acetyltransferase